MYERQPKPATTPLDAVAITSMRRNSSRAAGFVRCTETVGIVNASLQFDAELDKVREFFAG